MNVFLLLAHPERESFNGAMHDVAKETLLAAGHTVTVSELYADGFDPISDRRNFDSKQDLDYFKQQAEELHASEVKGFAADLELEMQKVEAADLMIWQFPLWWFGLPAILKGWVDRVFAMGRFYSGDKIYGTGVLKGKRAMLSLTTGGPPAAYEPGGFNGDINGVLRPIQRGMLEFVGLSVLAPQIDYAPAHLDDEERSRLLNAWAVRLRGIESESPIDVGSF